MRDTIEYFTQQFTNHQIDRRGLMRGLLSVGVGVGAAMTLADKLEAQTPKKGGHFKIGVGSGSTTDNLNPALANSTFNQTTTGGSLFCQLLEYGQDGKLVGELAESYEPSKDAKTWRFKIRKGCTFHNGKAITPDDVAANFNYHRDEKSVSKIKSLMSGIQDVKTDGDYVVVSLKNGNGDFGIYTTDYHFGIMPASDGKITDPLSGVGSGPYIKEKYEAGVSAVSKRFDGYFKPANFDSIEVISIKDVVARTNALTSGEVDFMDRCDLKTIELLKKNSKINIMNVVGYQHYTLPMLTDNEIFKNKDLRNAIKAGINRDELVAKVTYGYGKAGNDHPISPSHPDFPDKLEVTKYDPDKAKSLFKKSGFSGCKLSASEAAFAGALDAAALIQASLAKCGITMNIVKEADDGYWDKVWLIKPWCMSYWSGRVSAVQLFDTVFKTGAAWNETHMSSKALDDLLEKARVEIDPAKKKQHIGEILALIRDDGGSITPIFANYVNAFNSSVTSSGKWGADYDLDGLRILRRWWKA